MRVLVLDDDSWRGMGIARALDQAPGLTPVLERDLGEMTISKSLATVVLVAEHAASHDAKRSLRRLRQKFPGARILVHGELSDPAAIAAFMAQGADGYFVLSLGEEKLVKAIRVLARGGVWMPQSAVTAMVDHLRTGGPTERPPLTLSELRLLRMLEEGLSNKEIASRLGLAEVTVKTHFTRLFRRFNVKTRVQLLSHAIRQSLLK